MKVLHIGDISFVGSTLCRQMRARNIEADIISKKKGPIRNLDDDWIIYRKSALDEIKLCGIDLDDYDVIHAHYLINWGSLGLKLKHPKKPVILHCHGADARPHTIIHKMIQQYVASLSPFMLYSTPDILEDISWFRGRTIYLPNPVDIDTSPSISEKYPDRILIYGTLYRFKMIEKLFPFVEKSSYQFDMIDFGPDCGYYKKRAPANIRFIDPIVRTDIFREVGKYQLVLGASCDGSIRMCEIESMAMGIPTLFPFAYDHFYPEKLPMPDNWLEHFEDFLGDAQLGEQQRQWVETYHGAEKVVDQLLEVYERVL